MTHALAFAAGIVIGVAGTWCWLIGYVLREVYNNSMGIRR